MAGKLSLPLAIVMVSVSACAASDGGATPEQRMNEGFAMLAESSLKYRGQVELNVSGVTIAKPVEQAEGLKGQMGSASAVQASLEADPFLTAKQLSETKKTVVSSRIDQAARERVYVAKLDGQDWKKAVEQNWQSQLAEAERQAVYTPAQTLSSTSATRLTEERLRIVNRAKERLASLLPTLSAESTCTAAMDRYSGKLLRLKVETVLTYRENDAEKKETITSAFDFPEAASSRTNRQ
ncbi:hypothetical protein [Paenibacillus sp. MBLB4367]|uniref:hypothetical protein n=1 Tax=Paenibacillus sp. MBLB4367 TaxID=3384767 RepID=UPI003907FC31